MPHLLLPHAQSVNGHMLDVFKCISSFAKRLPKQTVCLVHHCIKAIFVCMHFFFYSSPTVMESSEELPLPHQTRYSCV